MSSLLDIKFNTLRQRLRELLYEPDAKRGRLRRELDVHSCFAPLRATLLVQWAADCDSPCFVLTNLLPTQAPHCTYSLRFWIECGFKDLKRGGLHWEQCKLSCPQRAERLWLVLSITLLQLATWTDLPETAGVYPLPRFSWLTRGWLAFVVTLLNRDPKPTHRPFAYDPAFLPRPKNTYLCPPLRLCYSLLDAYVHYPTLD